MRRETNRRTLVPAGFDLCGKKNTDVLHSNFNAFSSPPIFRIKSPTPWSIKIQLLSGRDAGWRNAISHGNASRRGAATPIIREKKGSRRVFRFRAWRRATESSNFLIVVGMSLCQRNLPRHWRGFRKDVPRWNSTTARVMEVCRKKERVTYRAEGGRNIERTKTRKEAGSFALTLISAIERWPRVKSGDINDNVTRWDIGHLWRPYQFFTSCCYVGLSNENAGRLNYLLMWRILRDIVICSAAYGRLGGRKSDVLLLIEK